MRDLHQHLAGAGDGKLREIVALVDSLPQRGAADNLIAPLRGRLTQLRPRRRLSLNRFLFLPADPVITPPSLWRRGALVIPRSALLCLGQLIRRELGPDEAGMAVAADGVQSDDCGAVLRLGRTIWPRAAAILAQAHMPPEWPGMTGLTTLDFLAVARPLSVLLAEGGAIEQMRQLGPAPEALGSPVRACLTRALDLVGRLPASESATLAGRCLGLLLSVLLARLPAAEALLVATGDAAARSGDPICRLAADSAVDNVLDRAETRLGQAGLALGVEELTRLATLLDALEYPGPACRPSRKLRAQALRRALDVHCRQRFQAEFAERLLSQLPQLGAATPDAVVGELEEAALDLRRLEAVGRAFGGTAHYERALAEGGQALLKAARPDISRADLARLTEILLGPEAALVVLDGPVG